MASGPHENRQAPACTEPMKIRIRWWCCAVDLRDWGGMCWVRVVFCAVGSYGAASLCARTRGEPSSAHCEQRLSERLTPRPCDPACACTGIRGHAGKGKSGQTMQRGAKEPLLFSSATPHAAQRAVPGWRVGLGRVGADLASAGSMRPPPTPARHVSTARLATTKASLETARHHTNQASLASNGTLPHTSAKQPQRQPQNTRLLKMRIAEQPQ